MKCVILPVQTILKRLAGKKNGKKKKNEHGRKKYKFKKSAQMDKYQ